MLSMLFNSTYIQLFEKHFIMNKNKHSSLLLPPHQLRIKILIELTNVINAIKNESLISIRQSNNN
jgi:hypothetical protein